jgi:hypothetical protein
MVKFTANKSARNARLPAPQKTAPFFGCRNGYVVPNYFYNEILIRYASRLAKNVAHRSARVCGLNLAHI